MKAKVDKISIINKETGGELNLHVDTTTVSWDSDIAPSINIHNSFQFDCEINLPSVPQSHIKAYYHNPAWKDACRLADRLNDLIEEYHAPGTIRKERRAIQREFDKTFHIFKKHCKTYMIDFKFVRPKN